MTARAARVAIGVVMLAISSLITPAHAAGGFTIRASLTIGDGEPDRDSELLSITPDGRFILFKTAAFNMGTSVDRSPGVYLRDVIEGTTTRIAGAPNNDPTRDVRRRMITTDGRSIVFASANNLFVYDRATQQTSDVLGGLAPNREIQQPSISSDGRYVSFLSAATNLVPDDTNGWPDVFWFDRVDRRIERVSVYPDGSEVSTNASDPVIDGSGMLVAFTHCSPLLAGSGEGGSLYVRDMGSGTLRLVSVTQDGSAAGGSHASITPDGRYIAFVSANPRITPGDNNEHADIFVRDMRTGATRVASITPEGRTGNDYSLDPSVSDDGQSVAFSSTATDLVPGDTAAPDVFIRDFRTGTTRRASAGANGQADAQSFAPMLTADGTRVAYTSDATNLVASDTNATTDVFFSRPYGDVPDAPTISTPLPDASVKTTFTIVGTSDPTARVELREGGVVLLRTTVEDTGVWRATVTLPEGAHTITATTTEATGLTSAPTTLHFTVDATPPTPPSLDSPSPGSTLVTTPFLVTGRAEPRSTVRLSASGVSLGHSVTDQDGNWTASIAPADGPLSIEARATDAAGNVGSASLRRDVIVDAQPPMAPRITGPVAGASLRDATIRVTGTAEPGSSVHLYAAGHEVGVVGAGGGVWTTTITLPDGPHTLAATATDRFGRTGAMSKTVSFTVDRTPPGVPIILSPSSGSVMPGTFRVTGSGEPSATIEIREGSTVLARATVDASGGWTAMLTFVGDGPRTIMFNAVDTAKNESGSVAADVIVDDSAPTVAFGDETLFLPSSTGQQGTAIDGHGVASVHIRYADLLRGGTTTVETRCHTCGREGTGPVDWTAPLPEAKGSYRVEAFAVDLVGNVGEPVALSIVRL